MLESTFLHEFRLAGGARLTDSLILFRKPLQAYNLDSDETTYFDSLSDLFAHVVGERTIKDIIGAAKPDDIFRLQLDGGRGSGSDDGQEFKFNHAKDRKGKGDEDTNYTPAFPAQPNARIKVKNVDEALKVFRQMHANDEYESAFAVDANGYVTHYSHGGKSSVSISSNPGDMIYHNHPSGGNFSDLDLINTSLSKERGIVASGKYGDYKFEKGTHFKAAEFVKAIKHATLKGKNYSDAADKWLKRNQKRYGYKYSFAKA